MILTLFSKVMTGKMKLRTAENVYHGVMDNNHYGKADPFESVGASPRSAHQQQRTGRMVFRLPW